MKSRIFKKPDGTVIVDTPTAKFQEHLHECKIPESCTGLPYVIEDTENVSTNSKKGIYHEMLYWDNTGIKLDKEWKERLMPVFLIKEKHIARIDKDLEDELAKPLPDPIKSTKLMHERNTCLKWPNERWYRQALTNLDRDEVDKPRIRAKLLEKIEGK